MSSESRPSQERTPPPRAIRIETETSTIYGLLVSAEGSYRTIAVTSTGIKESTNQHLLRFDVNSLAVGKSLDFEYSFDDGKSWQAKTSDSPLKGVETWERASKVTTLDDLRHRTVDVGRAEFIYVIGDELYSPYPEYEYKNEAKQYAIDNPNDAKISEGFAIDTGWKIHFTPYPPEHVVKISQYLIENGYCHKFLSGGSPGEGKAFTVYLGSRQMLEKWVKELESTLGDMLLPAMAEEEEEVSPHISARFTSVDRGQDGDPLFHQYGVHGMSAVYKTIKKRVTVDKSRSPFSSVERKELSEEAYDELSKRYGSYFHG